MKRWLLAQKVGIKAAVIGGCFVLAAAVIGGACLLMNSLAQTYLPTKPLVVILQTSESELPGSTATQALSAFISPTATNANSVPLSTNTVVEVGSPISTLSPEPLPFCQGRVNPPTPCQWIVEPNDSFEVIAVAVYGSRQQMLLVENTNRDKDGYTRRLYPGDIVLVDSPGTSTFPNYPQCVLASEGGGAFPCLYDAQPGETYTIIARRFYDLTAMRECISAANIRFDGVNIVPLASDPDADIGGSRLILPTQKATCP